ncbi:GNAT family N-acetyltransferase [Bradyrhizobium sp. SZCCHNRI1073]|uniref:GNAT family N-acetyltransferase n=1 Tax=Bradyrhizobium sp. SZCCHNRI1073 TaxID=3057280 RepID=UPI002916CBF2|nr:GNAT family N-acetyltransferase [Bradyrhizobium sp. SZCCHNRI1073]
MTKAFRKKTTSKRRKPLRPTPKPKPSKPNTLPPVAPERISLVKTKGTRGRGGDAGGEAWRVEVDDKRAGIVFINWIKEEPIGEHASIQIYLNADCRGREVGRVAYRQACEQSRYDEVYAHMRKSNIASKRSAEEAGFHQVSLPNVSQLVMVWTRPTERTESASVA